MASTAGRPQLLTHQVAEVLGVLPSTVYAYVSRGVLSSRTDVGPDGRRVSWFDRDDVLQLAAARRRPVAGTLATLVESDVSSIDARGTLTVRGIDVGDLVGGHRFEHVADVVWAHPTPGEAWPAPSPDLTTALSRGAPTLGSLARGSDRVRCALLLAADADPDRARIEPDHVRRVGRQAVQLAVQALAGGSQPPGGSIALGMCVALGSARPGALELRALDTAMGVLVDHELSVSTLAARAAAGAGADPWMVLLTASGVLSGTKQAAAGPAAGEVLARWIDAGTVASRTPPGFGHAVYTGVDPRARLLLDAVADVDAALVERVDALAVEVARTSGLLPNVDLALAALVRALGLPDGAAEAVFTVARIPGVLAHALEEYPHDLRFRFRSIAGHADVEASSTHHHPGGP